MGFFSFITGDTGKSISNKHSVRGALPVHMVMPDDTRHGELNYDGYGTFGGVDFHHAVGWLNGIAPKDGDPEQDNGLRCPGIDLYCAWADRDAKRIKGLIGDKTPIFPRFAEGFGGLYADLNDPTPCPQQGYFYDEAEDIYDD